MRGMATGDTTEDRTDDQSINWSTIKQLIPYLLEFKVRIVLALACLVLAKLASVTMPFILKHIVDDLDTGATSSSPFILDFLSSSTLLIPLALLVAYGLVRFGNVLFGELRDTLFGRVTERAMRRVGLKVFEHLHALDLDYHLNRRTGGLSRDIERGTTGISFLLRFMVFNIVPTFLEIGMVVGVLMWNYDIWYGLIILVSVVSYISFSVFTTEWRTQFIREANDADSSSNTQAVDSLLNYETVKYFSNETHEAKNYDTNLARWESARRNNRLSLFALNGGQAFIIAASMTAAMVLAAIDVSNKEMTIGDFVLINAFMMQIFIPLNFLGFVYREMKASLTNIEKMFDILDQTPKIIDKDDAKDLKVTKGEVVFENVKFSYETEREILKGISFRVPENNKIAIVGSSGAGKSTIMKLLFRFYDVNAGRVLIDGQDIKAVSQHSLRKHIGIVPQDTVLFNTSIFDNIRYGNINASDQEIWKAIELAHLTSFIEQLPLKEKTKVGERGLKLSGGEKQRVAIARAILKKPKIMIFDEATSSLDSHSEQLILQAIKEVSSKQTSLVIAHRLSTIVDADEVVVLEQGQIVEQGKHEELLKKQGHYAKLWELQKHTNNN
jgi:ATP-binding cassette subfamily B protein